jgi:hypothetical protein
VKSPSIKEVILTPVRSEDPVQDKELDSLMASEKRTRIIGLAAVFSLLTLTGMLLWWAFA